MRMKPFVLGKKAVVTNRLDERSYEVYSGDTLYRRNRAHLRKTEELPDRHIGLVCSPDSDMTSSKQSAKEHSSIQDYCNEQGEPKSELVQPQNPTIKAPEVTQKSQTEDCVQTSVKDPASTQWTRSGRAIRKPSRFKDFV